MENRQTKELQELQKSILEIGTDSDLLKCKPLSIQIKYHGKKSIVEYLKAPVAKCFLRLGLNVNSEVVDMLANDLVDKYQYDSIEDLIQCLKKGGQGYYGTSYNKLTMIVITDWMNKHLEDKARIREQHLKNKYQTEKEPLAVVDYEAFKKRITDKKPSIGQRSKKDLDEYVEKVCQALNVDTKELYSRSRKEDVTHVRGIIKDYQRNVLKMTREQIKTYWQCTEQ